MSQKQKNGPRQAGYSLIELMIVVAIIGVLAITINFTYSPANSRLKSAARDLYSHIQTARIEAAKSSSLYGIIFDNATDSYALCAYNDVNGTCDGDNTTVVLSDYGSGIQFGYANATKNATSTGGACPANCPADGISYTGNSLYFDTKGMSPKMGYIYLENNDNTTFAVGTASLAGVVKLRKWNGTNWE